MKKIICVMLMCAIISAIMYGCGNDDYGSYNNSSIGSKGYDYDKGYGYTAPYEGESFSDYVKRQDPDLYNDMKEIYDSLE